MAWILRNDRSSLLGLWHPKLLGPFLLTPFLGACGLAGTEGVFGKGGQDDGDGGASTTTSGEGGSGAEATTTSTGDTTSTTTGPGSSSSSAASSSAAMSSSSSGGGDQPQVYCAGSPCAPGEVCCFHESDPNQDHCGGANTCGQSYIEITCNGPEDCAGQTCCGQWTGNYYVSVTCAPSCNSVTVCGESPDVCDMGLACEPSGYLGNGYNVCK